MEKYELVEKSHSLLTTELPVFDFDSPPIDPESHYHAMVEAAIRLGGIGLASNQVGLPYRMFVIGDGQTKESYFPVYNPKIVWYSDETHYLDEGCLTFPGLFIKIKRPKEIRARLQHYNGKVVTHKFGGMTARIFQHELMHVNGKFFTDYVSKLQLEMAIKKAKKKYGCSYSLSEFRVS